MILLTYITLLGFIIVFANKDATMRFKFLSPLDALKDFFNVLSIDSFIIKEGV